MLKEKTFIEGETVSAIVFGDTVENLKIKQIKNKEELEVLIEELTQLTNYDSKEALTEEPTKVLEEVKTIVEEETQEETQEKTQEDDGEEAVSKETKTNVKNEEVLMNLKAEMEELFPSKEVNSADFRENHLSLYNKASKITKENGMSIKEFLENNGFEYLRKKRGVKKQGES